MKTLELKVARIGNSRGVRLPAATLRRYHIGEAVLMEERDDGIVLRSAEKGSPKLSWEDTAREMQASGEDWSDWDAVAADGVESLPWEQERSMVAEQRASYVTKPSCKRGGRSSKGKGAVS